VNYGEFLLQWYNLLFLAVGAGGLGLALYSRRRGRDSLPVGATALAAAVAGLTLNGAVHDLGLGALVLGAGAGWALTRARDRWFPPIEGVRWNPPGQEGAEARVVSSSVEEEPGSGRAQWQDEDGVVTLVRCHTAEGSMKFGARVRLEEYDEEGSSYRVVYRSE